MNRLSANLLAMSATTMQAHARDFYSYGDDQNIVAPIVANIVSGKTVEENVVDKKLGTGHFKDMYDAMHKNAPSSDVTNDDPVDPIIEFSNTLEHLQDNNMWAALVEFNGGSSAQKNGKDYIFSTGIGYLMTTSDLYTGDEDFAKNYVTSGRKSGWTDSGTTLTVNSIDQA